MYFTVIIRICSVCLCQKINLYNNTNSAIIFHGIFNDEPLAVRETALK